MSGHAGPELNLLEVLKRRTLFRVALAYHGTAWFFFHVVTVIGETFEPIHHLMRGFAYLLVAGLPAAILAAWLMERRAERKQLAHAVTAAGAAETRSRRLSINVAVVLVLAIGAIAADRWIFHRSTEQSMLALLGLFVVLLVVDRLFYEVRARRRVALQRTRRSDPAIRGLERRQVPRFQQIIAKLG
jgi:hypothetical protein